MTAALLRLLSCRLLDDAGSPPLPTNPRAGTRVALAFPLLALALVLAWAASGPEAALGSLGILDAAALAALASFFGRFQLDLAPRVSLSFERPPVLLAGLLGGPLAGALVGAAGGANGAAFVWRRRAAYGGIGACEGALAGFLGLAWQAGALPLEAAAAAAALAALAASVGGAFLIQLDRGIPGTRVLLQASVFEIVEVVLSIPVVALLAASYAERPLLVLAVAGSGMVVVWLASALLTAHREELAAERHARLRDWLTGALTRAALEDALERETARVLRGAQPAGLLVIDVDRFKAVNDTHRHSGGDAVLRQVAERLRAAMRGSDLLARWGGEEFCLVAPAIGSLSELAALAERLRAAVASAPFPLPAGDVAVTVSIGGTLLDGAVPAAVAFEHADEALYLAKRRRNEVRVLPPPRPRGEPATDPALAVA